MKRKALTEIQVENLLEQLDELRQKVNRRNQQLTLARYRLGNAKRNIKRLQEIIAYQRQRIVQLHPSEAVHSSS
jgi:peptidoglycan hydrolase CwlO-like protein